MWPSKRDSRFSFLLRSRCASCMCTFTHMSEFVWWLFCHFHSARHRRSWVGEQRWSEHMGGVGGEEDELEGCVCRKGGQRALGQEEQAWLWFTLVSWSFVKNKKILVTTALESSAQVHDLSCTCTSFLCLYRVWAWLSSRWSVDGQSVRSVEQQSRQDILRDVIHVVLF